MNALARIWSWLRGRRRASTRPPTAPSPEIAAAATMLREETLNRTTMTEQLREEAGAALRILRERDADAERRRQRRRYG